MRVDLKMTATSYSFATWVYDLQSRLEFLAQVNEHVRRAFDFVGVVVTAVRSAFAFPELRK